MAILSQKDHEFFEENGYLVVRQVVPADACAAVVETIHEHFGMDSNDQTTWYPDGHRNHGGIHLRHTPSMWQTRQSPRLYQAFTEIWQDDKLWCSMDIMGMKPPVHPDYPGQGETGFLHWDGNPSEYPMPFGLQGVVALTDTVENQGGFHCLPSQHKVSPQELGVEVDPEPPYKHAFDPERHFPVPVPAECGDIVVWVTALPHGNGANHSDRPRYCQYITMSPARRDAERRGTDFEQQRQARISKYEEEMQEGGYSLEDVLRPHGRKLVGYDQWEE